MDEPVWTTGIVDGALSFDGEDDYVEVQHNDNLNADLSFTVEAWIKLNSVGSYQTIVTKHHENWINGWQLVVTDNDIIQWDPTSSAGHQLLYGNTVLQKDVWYHVAGVLDDPNQRLYVNGVLDAEKIYSGIPITNSKTLEIGYSNYYRSYYSEPYYTHTTHWFFNGLVDEVAIYNRALSAEEIQHHYQNGLNGLGYEVVPATIDIDPDTLNLKSKGGGDYSIHRASRGLRCEQH